MRKMIVIGLTGGIGMGKSTAAKILCGFGYPVYNADHSVHALLRKGGKAVKLVAKLFPEALKRGAIDRKIVGQQVFHDPRKLKALEKIMHPLVRDMEKEFLAKARAGRKTAAVLEIPLLFETKGQSRCDVTFCVTAPKAVQRARVMLRPGMNEAKFRAIVARQMSNAERLKKADYIVNTGKDYADTKRQLRRIMNEILGNT